jgi:phosphoserine phosphatase RsbU/P
VPANQGPVSLLLAPILTGFQIYVDGRREGSVGSMPPKRIPNSDFAFHQFPLTREARSTDRTILVALRVWHSPVWSAYVGGGPFQSGHLADDPNLLASELNHHQLSRNVIFVDQYAYSIVAGLVGLIVLWLFYTRPAEREYLWFAVLLLSQAGDCVLAISRQVWSGPPIPVFDLSDGALVALAICSIFCFLSRILDVRIDTPGRVFLALAAVSPFMAILYWPGWLPTPASAALQLGCALPAITWILSLLVRRAISGNPDARLLVAPILLAQGFFVVYNLAVLLAQAGWTPWPSLMEEPLPLPPFTIHQQILLNLIFLISLLAFLIRRFTRARRREVRLAAEFEAARQVQDVLLPKADDQCPSFAVDFVYHPADEVGGDFFQQIADGHGGLILVVGDVSGKGLPAAMLVAALVGAVRAQATHASDPASLLSCLNDRLLGRFQHGFVTCMAARLSPRGRMILANAGHLPPYRNGKELNVAGSLPLGVLPGLSYDVEAFDIAPGDRLTFLSDGIVEAQDTAAARDFGQQDDITVVTVDFAGAP